MSYRFNKNILYTLCIITSLSFAHPNLDIIINNIPERIRNNIINRLIQSEYLFQDNLYKENKELQLSKINEQVREAIMPYGFFNAKANTHLTKVKNKWMVKIQVDLGSLSHIRHLSIEIIGPGKNDLILHKVLDKLPLKKGKACESENYNKTKSEIETWAQMHGYIKFNYEENMMFIPKEKTSCEIHIIFNTGPRYYVGPIHLNQSFLTDEIIYKYLTFKQGDVYNPEKLIHAYNRLASSDYYENVVIEPVLESTSKNNQIPINILLKPRKLIGVSVGGGYGTDTGLEGSLGIDWRRVNRFGHKLSTLFQISETLDRAQLMYLIPGKNPLTDIYTFSNTYQFITIPIGRSQSSKTTIAATSEIWTWMTTPSINLLNENYRFKRDNRRSHTLLLYPQLNISKKVVNDRLNPSEGYRISLDIFGSRKGYLSKISMLQSSLQFAFIKSHYPFRIISKNKIGTTSVDSLNRMPPSLQFIEGGVESIRGYSYGSINGGRHVWVSSIDLQCAVYKDWYLGTLFDIGNVFDNFKNKLKTSTGLTVTTLTPIGPVTVGIAKSFQRKAPELRFFFTIGPGF